MTTPQKRSRTERAIEITAHTLTWCYIFLSPLFFKRSGEAIDWDRYLHGSILPLVVCVAFYVNYMVLIPRCLLKGHHLRMFVGANVLFFVLSQVLTQLQGYLFAHGILRLSSGGRFPSFPPLDDDWLVSPEVFFFIRSLLTYVFAIGVAVALRLSMAWRAAEQARSEAELRRSQAELKNLKNQINPHFLLNTLNNIYALTAFDTDKAQSAILELSRMLRYMLYEDSGERTSLDKEVAFLRSYIALMRLRLGERVVVECGLDVPAGSRTQIAPLIFISLVENAFKHGVSPTEPSFIRFNLLLDGRRLHFRSENSNYPKTPTDKAPGGIGLEQVSKRLELAYPGRYVWIYGPSADGTAYISEIVIDLTAAEIAGA